VPDFQLFVTVFTGLCVRHVEQVFWIAEHLFDVSIGRAEHLLYVSIGRAEHLLDVSIGRTEHLLDVSI
jgi:hypothetical protein